MYKIMACPCCGFRVENDLVIGAYKVLKKHFPKAVVTSWCRCDKHNKKVGGASQSKHMDGLALDITYDNPQTLHGLIVYGAMLGMKRAFIYRSHVHLDCYGNKPHMEVQW